MMEECPSDELNTIGYKLKCAKIQNEDDKYNFRDNVLPKRLYQYGIEYAD